MIKRTLLICNLVYFINFPLSFPLKKDIDFLKDLENSETDYPLYFATNMPQHIVVRFWEKKALDSENMDPPTEEASYKIARSV